jgi:hypothetical protein
MTATPEQMQRYGLELAARVTAIVQAVHHAGPREITARVLHAHQLRHPGGANPAIAVAVALAAALPDPKHDPQALVRGLGWVRECDPYDELDPVTDLDVEQVVAPTPLRPQTYRDPTRYASKLTATDVQTIRGRVAAGDYQKVIAADFGISTSHVDMIARRQRWTHIPDTPSSTTERSTA